jgi:hypothetical protein
MSIRDFFKSAEARAAWRRGLLMVLVGLLLIGIAIGLRVMLRGPSAPSGVYHVTQVYGQGGFAEPLYLQTITVRRQGLILEGGSGGVVTGMHHIRHVNGPLVLICGARDGGTVQAQISKNHQRIRIRLGQCLVEGRRS